MLNGVTRRQLWAYMTAAMGILRVGVRGVCVGIEVNYFYEIYHTVLTCTLHTHSSLYPSTTDSTCIIKTDVDDNQNLHNQ